MADLGGTRSENMRMGVMGMEGSVAGDTMARAMPIARTDLSPTPAVNLWTSRVSHYEQYAMLFHAQWVRYWRYYRAWRQPLTEPLDWWRSNEVIPTCFKIIETLVPKYVFGVFDSPDWFQARGTEPTDEIWELAITSLLKEQLEEMKVVPTVIEGLKYGTIMGHVWFKTIWKEEYRTRQVLEPKLAMDPDLGIPTQSAMRKTTMRDKVMDRPDLQWITLDRIKTSPDGSGRWFIEVITTTLEELQETNRDMGGGLYQNLDKIQGIASSVAASTNSSFMEPQSTETLPQWLVDRKDGTPVVLWQCWGWVPPAFRGKDDADWRLTVIANRNTVIRDVDAPTPDGKPPYFGVKSIPVPGILFGDSLLRYAGPLADQQTRLANHRLDEIMLNVWGQLIIDATAGITNNEMLFQPGGVLFVQGNPSDKVMPLQRRPLPPETYKEDDYRQTQAEHAVGATDIMQGLNANDRSTAQEINTKLTQSGMRVTAHTLWLQETMIKPLLTRIYEWLQMRMPQDKILRVVGSDGVIYNVTLDIQSLQIPIDITIGGGLLGLSKNTRLQDFQEMIALLANPTAAPFLRTDEILREYYRTKGIRNVDRFIKTQMELMGEQQMGMDQGGMGMGPPGLGSGQPEMGDQSAQGGGGAALAGVGSANLSLPAGSSGGGLDQAAGQGGGAPQGRG